MERDDLREAAIFGHEVELFLGTPVGIFLTQRLTEEFENAFNRLRYADPTDHKAIATNQTKLDVFEDMHEWLKEAVAAGAQAAKILNGEDEDE